MELIIRIFTSVLVFFALQSVAHGSVIEFNDDINQASMDRLVAKVFAAYGAGDRNITLRLDSTGGELNQALRVLPQLRALGVNTLVKNLCASSCTVLFTAGRTRSASENAQFMFHKVSFSRMSKALRYNKKKNPNGLTAEQARMMYVTKWSNAIRAVAPALADELDERKILVRGDATYFSGRDLRDSGYVND